MPVAKSLIGTHHKIGITDDKSEGLRVFGRVLLPHRAASAASTSAVSKTRVMFRQNRLNTSKHLRPAHCYVGDRLYPRHELICVAPTVRLRSAQSHSSRCAFSTAGALFFSSASTLPMVDGPLIWSFSCQNGRRGRRPLFLVGLLAFPSARCSSWLAGGTAATRSTEQFSSGGGFLLVLRLFLCD